MTDFESERFATDEEFNLLSSRSGVILCSSPDTLRPRTPPFFVPFLYLHPPHVFLLEFPCSNPQRQLRRTRTLEMFGAKFAQMAKTEPLAEDMEHLAPPVPHKAPPPRMREPKSLTLSRPLRTLRTVPRIRSARSGKCSFSHSANTSFTP